MPEPKSPQVDARVMEVLGRLQAACASDSNASLLAAHMSLSCAGRLRSASPGGVVIEIPNPPMSDITLLGSTAAVSFPVGDKMAGFVAPIIELALSSDGTLMATLELPDRLQFGDRRSAVRIPVPRGSLHATILVSGGAPTPTRAVDVSLTGILLELERTHVHALQVGGRVTLGLRLGTRELVVDAEICRRDGLRFGLRYLTDGAPPPGMAKLIFELQEARRPRR